MSPTVYRWQRLARQAGVSIARSHATLDDLRMWQASARRYAGGFNIKPPLALEDDEWARWWARWFPWWPA